MVVPAARSEEKKHVKVVRSVTAKALAAEQEVLLNKEVEEIQIEENYIEEQKEESVIVEQKQQKQAGRSSYSAAKTNYAYVAPHRKKDRNWSIGLSTGNGTFSSSTSMDGYLPLPNGARNATMNSAYGVETRAEIDKLVQFTKFQKNIRCPESVQIFNNYNIIISHLEEIKYFIKMFIENRIVFYNLYLPVFQIQFVQL